MSPAHSKFAVLMLMLMLMLMVMPKINRAGQHHAISDLNGAALGLYFLSPIGFIILLVGVGIAYKTANGSSSN